LTLPEAEHRSLDLLLSSTLLQIINARGFPTFQTTNPIPYISAARHANSQITIRSAAGGRKKQMKKSHSL
jgi:hypothetical protein